MAELGRQAVKRNDFESARRLFRGAFERTQHYAFAGSLAVVEMELGLYADAAAHWEFFLAHMDERASDKRAAVTAQLQTCRERLGRFSVSANEPDAILIVDGRRIGPLPRTVYLAPGQHQMVARLGERVSVPLLVTSNVGRAQKVTLDLPAPSDPTAPELDQPSSASAPRALGRPAPWGPREYVLVGGAALTLAGLTTGTYGLWKHESLARDAHTAVKRLDTFAEQNSDRDRDSLCLDSLDEKPPECAELEHIERHRPRMKTMAWVGFVSAGGVALVTGLTYWFWPKSTTKLAEPARSGTPMGTMAPWATYSSAGVTLTLPWR